MVQLDIGASSHKGDLFTLPLTYEKNQQQSGKRQIYAELLYSLFNAIVRSLTKCIHVMSSIVGYSVIEMF